MLETTGQQSWRCSAARQHECALAMGLAHHPTTCCTPTRVRYLQQSDWPHLLRLKDAEATEETCEAAVHAYACTERAGIRPRGFACEEDENEKAGGAVGEGGGEGEMR